MSKNPTAITTTIVSNAEGHKQNGKIMTEAITAQDAADFAAYVHDLRRRWALRSTEVLLAALNGDYSKSFDLTTVASQAITRPLSKPLNYAQARHELREPKTLIPAADKTAQAIDRGASFLKTLLAWNLNEDDLLKVAPYGGYSPECWVRGNAFGNVITAVEAIVGAVKDNDLARGDPARLVRTQSLEGYRRRDCGRTGSRPMVRC